MQRDALAGGSRDGAREAIQARQVDAAMAYRMAREVPLFSALDDAQLGMLLCHARLFTVARGQALIREGEVANAMYLVVSGTVKIHVSDHLGKDAVLGFESAGGYFGEIALVDDEPRSATVTTIEETRLLAITRRDFRACLMDDPSISMAVARSLAQRVRSLTDTVRNLALKNASQRVVTQLLAMAEPDGDEWVIRHPLTRQTLGEMVGASREMVSRIMSDLTVGGYIRTVGRTIRILRPLPESAESQA